MLNITHKSLTALIILSALTLSTIPLTLNAQDSDESSDEQPEETQPLEIGISLSGSNQILIDRNLSLNIRDNSRIPDNLNVREVLWDFGDGIRTTGEKVEHTYQKSGRYTITARLTTEEGPSAEDTTEVAVFDQAIILITDTTVSEADLELRRQQAAQEDILLTILRARGGGPEVLIEEELANQLADARDTLGKSNLIISWTSGSVGSSVLSKFAQHIRVAEEFSSSDLKIEAKGVIILSDTPFAVLAPTAQSAFDGLSPSYVLLTRPSAIDLLLEPLTAEEAKEKIFVSPLQHRLLGTFSSRTVSDIGLTNFVSFGINYLVNHDVPIGNITLILMLPVIATILSFSRQVVGIKAFGLITPAMTTLSFLVVGLQYGLIVFSVVLISGTITRLLMRRLNLLYLPRMALVLTNVSFSILVLFGIGISVNNTSLLSFSVFPILILTLLAEEFIALQFKSGPRQALIVTAWTIALSVICYFIVSWELLRTVILSYPEVVLLAIPANLLLGRWSGLRLTEYFRFRKLLRYVQ